MAVGAPVGAPSVGGGGKVRPPGGIVAGRPSDGGGGRRRPPRVGGRVAGRAAALARVGGGATPRMMSLVIEPGGRVTCVGIEATRRPGVGTFAAAAVRLAGSVAGGGVAGLAAAAGSGAAAAGAVAGSGAAAVMTAAAAAVVAMAVGSEGATAVGAEVAGSGVGLAAVSSWVVAGRLSAAHVGCGLRSAGPVGISLAAMLAGTMAWAPVWVPVGCEDSGTAVRAAAKASIVAKRSPGSLARLRRRASSTSAGMSASGATSRGGRGGRCRCIDTRRTGLASVKGTEPVRSS